MSEDASNTNAGGDDANTDTSGDNTNTNDDVLDVNLGKLYNDDDGLKKTEDTSQTVDYYNKDEPKKEDGSDKKTEDTKPDYYAKDDAKKDDTTTQDQTQDQVKTQDQNLDDIKNIDDYHVDFDQDLTKEEFDNMVQAGIEAGEDPDGLFKIITGYKDAMRERRVAMENARNAELIANEAELRADKELGGEQYEDTKSHVNNALHEIGPNLARALKAQGLLYDKEIVRELKQISIQRLGGTSKRVPVINGQSSGDFLSQWYQD